MRKEHGAAVLLVEPNARLTRLAVAELVRSGWVIAETTSAAEALEVLKAQASTLSLVIADDELPDGHGSDVLDVAGKAAPWAARILVSPHPGSERTRIADALVPRPWKDGALVLTADRLVFSK